MLRLRRPKVTSQSRKVLDQGAAGLPAILNAPEHNQTLLEVRPLELNTTGCCFYDHLNQTGSQGQRHVGSTCYNYHHNRNAVCVSVHCALTTLLNGDLPKDSHHDNTSSKGYERYDGCHLDSPETMLEYAGHGASLGRGHMTVPAIPTDRRLRT